MDKEFFFALLGANASGSTPPPPVECCQYIIENDSVSIIGYYLVTCAGEPFEGTIQPFENEVVCAQCDSVATPGTVTEVGTC